MSEEKPFEPVTTAERESWNADAEIRFLLNRAAARGTHEFRATVETLRTVHKRMVAEGADAAAENAVAITPHRNAPGEPANSP